MHAGPTPNPFHGGLGHGINPTVPGTHFGEVREPFGRPSIPCGRGLPAKGFLYMSGLGTHGGLQAPPCWGAAIAVVALGMRQVVYIANKLELQNGGKGRESTNLTLVSRQ